MISLSICFGFDSLRPASAQIEWALEAQISLDDVYDDWFPRIAAGPDGRVWVVWRGFSGYGTEILYSMNDGTAWSYPARVGGDDHAGGTLPDIAVGPDGNPWAVWYKLVDGTSRLFWSRWHGAEWQPVQPVFPEAQDLPPALTPNIAVGPDAMPSIVWVSTGQERATVVYHTRWEGDSWSPPDTIVLLPGTTLGYPVAVGPDGRVWVVISHSFNSDCSIFSTWWEDGVWAPFDTLPGVSGHVSSLAITPEGELWAAGYDSDTLWAICHSSGPWGNPEQVPCPDSTNQDSLTARTLPDIAISSTGTIWGVWKGFRQGAAQFNVGAYGSQRITGIWASEQKVNSLFGVTESAPKIALTPCGQAWAVWQGWDGNDFEILYSHSIGVSTDEGPSMGLPIAIRWAPNPVLGGEITRAYLPSEGLGNVHIYDLAGRLIRRLHITSTARSQGSAVVTWDCRDAAERPVPSGMYFWGIQEGGRQHRGPVVVVR